MSSLELGLCLFGLVLGGFLMGLAVGRTRITKPHAPSPYRKPHMAYRPVRHAYPMEYQMRRRMVMQDITSGKLSLDEAKQYLNDHTLSLNDYKCAVSARKQLEDFDRFVKWFEEYKQ